MTRRPDRRYTEQHAGALPYAIGHDPATEIRCRPAGRDLELYGVSERGRWWSLEPLPACAPGESPYVIPREE